MNKGLLGALYSYYKSQTTFLIGNNMERYKLSKKFPSCTVSKKLIKELEKYLLDRIPKKMKGVLSLEEDKKINYKIQLKDKYGEEHFTTIDEYHRDRFPNDTQSIHINYFLNRSDLSINIEFSEHLMLSDIRIDLQCEGAKEIVQGIYSEIHNVINEHKTIHYVFYGSYTWSIIAALAILLFTITSIKTPHSDLIADFLKLIIVFYFILKFFAPYSRFETIKTEKLDKATSWVLNGLAGVLVFGVIATHIRGFLLI